MRRTGTKRWRATALAAVGLGFAAFGAAVQGCDDASDTTSTSSGSTSGMGGDASSSTTTQSGPTTTTTTTSVTTTSTGTGGAPNYACATTLPDTNKHSSAIAISPDDGFVVVPNKDVGSVSVLSVDYTDGNPKMTKVIELPVGADKTSEPSQVVIDGCSERAWVTLRKEQVVVEIQGINSATPSVGRVVNTGSEPTGIVGSEDNTHLYVANWVEGTITVIETATFTVEKTIDLNTALAGSGLLGAGVTGRPALAHPRGLAINGTKLYATEWYAQRTAAESAGGANTDTNKEGIVYEIDLGSDAVSLITLPAVTDTGFNDHNSAVTGCFPNQVASINISNGFAYVTSTCASPKGPLGVFAPTAACTLATQAQVCGSNGGVCDQATLKCLPNTVDVQASTHPALSVIDLATKTAGTTNLDKLYNALAGTKRMPLLPTDISFFNGFGYISSLGTDALYRVAFGANGQIASVGSPMNNFISLRKPMGDTQFRTPVGVAMAHTKGAFGFVANESSRDVTAVAFNTQAIAGAAGDERILNVSALPAANSPEEAQLRGKAFFNTGLGRWSLRGEGWGSCGACHVDGLSDNVTWYFNRGPRQSVSLDGSFASKDPDDQRIFNWTAIFDEVPDFEGNTRNVSGGIGALVTQVGTPPSAADRINTGAEVPPQQALMGSSEEISNPAGTSAHPHTVLKDWLEIKAWIQVIRSPRKPVGLVAADVTAGKELFQNPAKGNCVGCHSGAKWTISTRFYTPNDTNNPADGSAMGLEGISWNTNLNGFPTALFPISMGNITNSKMRFGATAAQEQLQCALRPVGTFNISSPEIGVVELRQDMSTLGQGSGATAADPGIGFNIPSLLGIQVGGPFYHAGNARTLEETFSSIFVKHHQSPLAAVFNPDATQIKQLVAYLLSIDESEPTVPKPAKGATGGELCSLTP